MTTQVKKIETLTVSLDAKPGALAKLYSAFREAKVNIVASWGYQMGPGEAQAHFYASDVKKATDVLTKLGKPPKIEQCVYAEGTDQIGSYDELLQKIAKSGVNIEATDAFALGGKFATVFFVNQKDIGALCRALGC